MGSIIFSFRNFRKAFTLIELMIVISIIGILAAALYPQVGKYMGRSRDAGRITALANIGSALDSSRFDYDGNYPPHSSGCVPVTTLVAKRYIASDIISPSGTGYNEGCGNNGQYAYGNLGIGNILMATMENLQGGNYSGSTDGFTGTITKSGIVNAMNTQKGVGKFYIRPTNYILNNAIFLAGSLTGSCGTVANTCAVGTATGYIAATCGSPETWTCLGSTGSLNVNCNTTRSCSTVGACGTANGFPRLTYPVGGFCSDIGMSVTPNDIVGNDGTFNWTCNGIGGAGAVACSAIRQYTISGTFTNGSGAIVNTCGSNTTANVSGNFTTTRNHGSNCSNIVATRPAYTCNTTTQGPVSLTSNTNTIAGSCILNTYTISGGFGTNAAGATIDVCGINTTADASGNFSVTRNGESNCSIISATKLNYTCSSLTGPSFLTSNIVAGNTSCTADTQSTTCGGSIPANATASTVSTYTQTWNGSIWTPTTNWGESQGTCDFNCNINYTWNGTMCAANTQTYTCSAKPATGTVWNTVSSYLQTWNGSAWSPANSTTSYNTTASSTSCNYVCASGYGWDGISCVTMSNGVCGSANGVTTAAYPAANWCTAGTKADVDTTGSDGAFNWSCNGSGGGTNVSCSASKVSQYPGCNSTDITLGNGQIWASCNVGSTIAGLTSASYGGLYTWSNSLTICPSGYHLPSISEWCSAVSSINSSIPCALNWVYDTSIRTTLKLPLAGNSGVGAPLVGTIGYYWSSDPYSSIGYYLTVSNSGINPKVSVVPSGTYYYSTRCLKDYPINGSCGSANGVTTASYPTANWCTTGTKVDVDIVGSDGAYNWDCNGSGGGTNVNCSAFKTPPITTSLAWTNFDKTVFAIKYGNVSTRTDIATFLSPATMSAMGFGQGKVVSCTDEGKFTWTGGGKGGLILICQRGNWWHDTGAWANDYLSPDVLQISTPGPGAAPCNQIGFRGYYPKGPVKYICK